MNSEDKETMEATLQKIASREIKRTLLTKNLTLDEMKQCRNNIKEQVARRARLKAAKEFTDENKPKVADEDKEYMDWFEECTKRELYKSKKIIQENEKKIRSMPVVTTAASLASEFGWKYPDYPGPRPKKARFQEPPIDGKKSDKSSLAQPVKIKQEE